MGLTRTLTFKHALTQEVAYNTMLLERRRGWHERAAQAIEALFPERLAEHYHELAHHYSRSGNTAKAVDYLHRAGQQAVEHSAYAEAISHLTTALDLLTTLPESRERSQQELLVQMALGTALRTTKGQAAPEVERLYARELCEQVGEPPQLFRVLWGLWGVYGFRGEYQTERAVGEELLSLAQRLHAALCLWLLGYPDQAVASMQAVLALAEQLAHPYSLTLALHWAAMLHQLRREVSLVQVRAEAAMTIATDQELPELFARTTPLRSWALAVSGHGEEGITQIQQGLAAYRATGATRDRPYYLALLAEASAQVGQTTEGPEALAEALATLAKSTARWCEAELYRLKGELLLAQESKKQKAQGQRPKVEEAEACFHQALAVARRQQAKSLELRAAMHLSRLWQRQGKGAQARQLLAPIYDWFTEGFNTADLQEVQVLLAELA